MSVLRKYPRYRNCLFITFICALFLFLCACENAPQYPESSAVESVQSGTARLNPRQVGELNAALQAKTREIYRRHGLPGLTVAYGIPDQAYVSGFAAGMADRETGRTMQPNTMMLSASIGKTFFGALTAQLYAEQVVSPEDYLSKWLGHLPWFDRLPNAEKIQLKHLTNHSAGLKDHVHYESFSRYARQLRLVDPDATIPPEKTISFILDEKPLFAPGEGYAYTDTGFHVLGMALERASGKKLYDLVEERFVAPLGLYETHKAIHRHMPNIAQGYGDPQATRFRIPLTLENGLMTRNPGSEWTGGGYSSSALDLVRWFSALFTTDIATPNYAATVRVNAIENQRPDLHAIGAAGYGMGMGVKFTTWGCAFSHVGWTPNYRSSVDYYPESNVTISFMFNTDHPEVTTAANRFAIQNQLARVVHAALGISEQPAPTPAECVSGESG